MTTVLTISFVLLLFCIPAKASIQFNEGDRILLYGNSFIERMQQNGFLEATIQLAHPGKKIWSPSFNTLDLSRSQYWTDFPAWVRL